MCGRYRLARQKEILAEVFDVGDDDDWSPRYNIAPSQSVPVVRQAATRPARSISVIRWGLIPFWAKDAKAGYKMINARAETIAEKPAFREPLLSRRCLIPADGFYEWSKFSKGKSPFCFTLADDSVFAFAGIWDRWMNPERELLETCSIITTSANALLPEFMTECRLFSIVKTMIVGLIPDSSKLMTYSICSNRTNQISCAATA